MWGKTRSAINKGYGMVRRKYEIPEVFGDINTPIMIAPRHLPGGRRGGKAMIKGSPEAKRRMAYLRSLRGKKLSGSGSYTSAALEGYGVVDTLSSLVNQFGDSILTLIKAAADNFGTSVNELASDPEKLTTVLSTYAPSIGSKIKSWFLKLFGKKKKKQPTAAELNEIDKMIKDLQAKKRKLIEEKPSYNPPREITPSYIPYIPSGMPSGMPGL